MKRLIAIGLLALVMLVGLGAAFDTSSTGKRLSGGASYVLWHTKGIILYIDSVAKRDTGVVMWNFYGMDSVQVTMKATGATASPTDDDSLMLILYTVDWWGTYTLNDTIIKGPSADDGDGITTVYSTASRLSPGIAIEVKSIGIANKPDTVQVIVAPVNTY